MLARHYAPATRLRLDARDVQPRRSPAGVRRRTCQRMRARSSTSAPSGDLAEAAANLFAALRALDASGASAIAVMPIPAYGLGEAINDRLRRAARAE